MLDYTKSFINSQNRGTLGVFNLWIVAADGILPVYGASCIMIDESLN